MEKMKDKRDVSLRVEEHPAKAGAKAWGPDRKGKLSL